MAHAPRSLSAFSLLLAAVLLLALGAIVAPASANPPSDRGNGNPPSEPGSSSGQVGQTEDREWADPGEATITPGVQMVTEGGQCTANFVFTDGSEVFIGYAAHCAGTGDATTTDGCEAESLPIGTEVDIEGASQPGSLAYSSWRTMDDIDEQDPNTCAFNDFALVSIHPDDHDAVNPSIPFWGGPDALGGTSEPMDKAYTYGNSSLRLGIELLSPKEGYSLGQSADGWSHQIYTVTPGIPGDSGSAVLDREGNALGSISTVQLAPLAGSNGVADLALALAYANGNGDVDAELATGTEPFGGGLVLPELTTEASAGSVSVSVGLH